MNASAEGLLFDLNSIIIPGEGAFEFPSSKVLDCSGPCLEITMEAYSVDDMNLYMATSSNLDQQVYVLGVEGLAPRGSDQGVGGAGSGVYCSCEKRDHSSDSKYAYLIRHGLIGNDTDVGSAEEYVYRNYDNNRIVNKGFDNVCAVLKRKHAFQCSRPTKKELNALGQVGGTVTNGDTRVKIIIN